MYACLFLIYLFGLRSLFSVWVFQCMHVYICILGWPLFSKLLILLLPSLRCICPENTIKMPIKPRRFQKSRFFLNFVMLCRYANIESPKKILYSPLWSRTFWGVIIRPLEAILKRKQIFWSPFHLRKVEKTLKTCNFLMVFWNSTVPSISVGSNYE